MSRFTLDRGVDQDLDAIWDYIGIQNHSPAAAVRQIELLYEKFVLLARPAATWPKIFAPSWCGRSSSSTAQRTMALRSSRSYIPRATSRRS